MSFTTHNNLEVPDGGVQNWDTSMNENFELIEKGPTIKATAGLAIGISKVVYMNASERLTLAISPPGSTTASQFLGFTTTAINQEVDGYVQMLGNHKHPDWVFTPGPVYLDASTAGDITQTEPATSTLVGYAIGTNELAIRPWVNMGSGNHGILTGLEDDDHTQYLRTDNFRSTSGLTVTGTLAVDIINPATEDWVSIQAGLTVGDLNIQGTISGIDHSSIAGLDDDDHSLYLRTDSFRSTSGLTITGAMQVDTITPYSENWVSIQAGLTVGDLTVQGLFTGAGTPSDHGTLSGLDDDDHTQYFRIDNARSVTGITVTGAIQTDIITPTTEDWVSIQAGLTVGDLTIQGVLTGGGSSDHGALSGLDDDDHTQYLTLDNARSTSGLTVTGNLQIDGEITGLNVYRKNVLINGDFNLWQRGTNFPAVSTNDFSADRFKYTGIGTSVLTFARSAVVPTKAQAGHLSNYSLLADTTTADVSIAAGDLAGFRHRIEGYDFAPLAQKELTLSFWHKHTKTGTYCVGFLNSDSGYSLVEEYTQSVSDTWEKATIVMAASTTSGNWNYTNGTGLDIFFTIASGTTFQTAAGSWTSGTFVATSNQVNGVDSTANNFRLAQIQLEEGGVATSFETKSYASELVKAQRFYEKSYDMDDAPATVVAEGSSRARAHGTSHNQPITFRVPKRSTPTIVSYSISNASGKWRDVDAASDLTVTNTNIGLSAFTVEITSSVDDNTVAGHWTADAEL